MGWLFLARKKKEKKFIKKTTTTKATTTKTTTTKTATRKITTTKTTTRKKIRKEKKKKKKTTTKNLFNFGFSAFVCTLVEWSPKCMIFTCFYMILLEESEQQKMCALPALSLTFMSR